MEVVDSNLRFVDDGKFSENIVEALIVIF